MKKNPVAIGAAARSVQAEFDGLTTNEARDLTGYTTEYVRRLARSGAVKVEKRGRDWYFDRQDLLDYVARRDAAGNSRFNPWRPELADRGRGRKRGERGIEISYQNINTEGVQNE